MPPGEKRIAKRRRERVRSALAAVLLLAALALEFNLENGDLASYRMEGSASEARPGR